MTGTARDGGAHPGLRVVAAVAATVDIDEGWSVREPDGLRWWPYRLAQRISCSRPVVLAGRATSTVTIRTEVLAGVEPRGATHPAEVLAAPNRAQALGALVWDPGTGSVAECSTAVVHDANEEWITPVLATAAVLQATAAHARAHGLAAVLGGDLPVSHHPTGGIRPTMDPVLDVPAEVIATTGDGPSRFSGALLDEVAELADDLGLAARRIPGGLVCRVPWPGDAAVAQGAAGGAPTATVRIEVDRPHPQLGSGAAVTLHPPVGALGLAAGDHRAAAVAAAELALVESRGTIGTSLLGAWWPDPGPAGGVGFGAFVPDLLARPGLLGNMLLQQAVRSRLAADAVGSREPGSTRCREEDTPWPGTTT